MGCAQTGTGKTAAFAIPIIQNLYLDRPKRGGGRKIRALVVTPTRELALQIGENFQAYAQYTPIKHTTIFGGVKQHAQVMALNRGVDILVATPGRLLDLHNQGIISLADIEYFVLDEADQMLDMGFLPDIKRVMALLPTDRQSLFFSATLPPNIVALSQKILEDPKKVTIKPEQPTAERVEQSIYFVEKKSKVALLTHLLDSDEVESALVFSRTKHGADKIVRKLVKAGIRANAIHGNKSQPQRQKALGAFKRGKVNVLVATDIAARGIDVSGLSHVINFDLPNAPETYVHRIGRTGRAGASGIALSFCNDEEKDYLKDIQKLIRQEIPVVDDHPWHDLEIAAIPIEGPFDEPKKFGKGKPSRGGGGGGRGRSGNRRKNSSRSARSGGGGRGRSNGNGGRNGKPSGNSRRSGSGGGRSQGGARNGQGRSGNQSGGGRKQGPRR